MMFALMFCVSVAFEMLLMVSSGDNGVNAREVGARSVLITAFQF